MGKTERQKTCRQRVHGDLYDRIKDLEQLWKAECNGKDGVEDLGNLNEYGLSFDYVAPRTFNDQREGYFRYQLSWGGPSDEFRYYTGPELKPHRVEYWFLDWFDGAHVTLTGAREKLLLELFDWFAEAGCVERDLERARE